MSFLFIFLILFTCFFQFYIPHVNKIIWFLTFSVLFHLVWYSQGPSIFLQMAVFKPFLWLGSIETSNEAGNPNVLKASVLEYQIFTQPGYSFSSRSSAPPLGSVSNQGREKRRNWLPVCHPVPTKNTSAMSNLRSL